MTPGRGDLALTVESGPVSAISRQIPVPVALCDPQGVVLMASDALRGLLPGLDASPSPGLGPSLAAAGVADAEARVVAARRRPQTVAVRSGDAVQAIQLRAQPASAGHWLVWFVAAPDGVADSGDPAEIQSRIAHDLRSPLAVIQSYAGLLATGQPGPLTPTQREFLAGIDTKVAEVSRLLDDLLDLGRLEAGTLDLHPEPIALQELLARLEQDLAAAVAAAEVKLLVEVVPDDLVVHADALRLRQCLEALIADAMAASEAGQQVAVAAAAAEDGVELTVADQGAAFDTAEDERVFTPYGGRRGSRRAAGTGLALAVAARLIALHGGRLGVAALPAGGTRFRLWLPAAGAAPDAR